MDELYEEITGEVRAAIRRIKAGDVETRSAAHAVRDMRQLLLLVFEERSKVARLTKQDAGIVHDYALDFDAARAEIGRRLARLRDAGDG